MKKPLVILISIFTFAGCCNGRTRERALYSNPKTLIQKIVNYVIENGEQSCVWNESSYNIVISDTQFFVEEAEVVVKRKNKDFFIHTMIYREDGTKMEEFDFYDYGANAKLNRYYGVKYDEVGNAVEELFRDFDKNKECINGICETRPSAYFVHQQVWFSRYYLSWMAEDLGIEF